MQENDHLPTREDPAIRAFGEYELRRSINHFGRHRISQIHLLHSVVGQIIQQSNRHNPEIDDVLREEIRKIYPDHLGRSIEGYIALSSILRINNLTEMLNAQTIFEVLKGNEDKPLYSIVPVKTYLNLRPPPSSEHFVWGWFHYSLNWLITCIASETLQKHQPKLLKTPWPTFCHLMSLGFYAQQWNKGEGLASADESLKWLTQHLHHRLSEHLFYALEKNNANEHNWQEIIVNTLKYHNAEYLIPEALQSTQQNLSITAETLHILQEQAEFTAQRSSDLRWHIQQLLIEEPMRLFLKT